MTLDESTAKRLRSLHEEAELSKAEDRMKNGWWAAGPYFCVECATGIRKPRIIKSEDGGRRATLTWCSQTCHDLWMARVNERLVKSGRSTRWERYDANGILIGYVIPRKGYVSLEQIVTADAERDAA